MEKIVYEPWSITLSIRLYTALLHIYPSTFQKEYGWLMAQVFGDCCRRVIRDQGVFGLIPFWVRTMLGLLVSFGRKTSRYGYLSLLVGTMSGLVSAGIWLIADLLGLKFFSDNVSWFLFLYGMGLMFTGLAVWGIDCLRNRLLNRGNGFALLSGVWFPIFIVISSLYEAVTGKWFDFQILDLFLFGLTVTGLVGLGFQLQSEWRQKPSPLAT